MLVVLSQLALAVEVPRDYPTLGDALLAVPAGGLIEVSAGRYAEDLAIVQDVTIRSLSGPAYTFIEGAGAPTMVTVNGASLEIEGFTLDSAGLALNIAVFNGDLTLRDIDCTGSAAGASSGGCLHVSGSTALVDNSRFYSNSAGPGVDGGHIGALSSTLTVMDSIFIGADARWGGAIYAESTILTLQGARFDGNGASQCGGAVYTWLGAVTRVEDSWFFDNSVGGGGGGLCVDGAVITTVLHSVFIRNDAVGDGGGALLMNTVAEVDGSIFQNNQSDNWGGALEIWSSPASILSNTWFEDNYAPNLRGGAASIYNSASTEILDNAFFANRSGGSSGAFHVDQSAATIIEGNLVCGNLTEGSGLDGVGADAGGFMVAWSDGTQIRNNIVVDNESSDDAGGISNQDTHPSILRNNTVISNISGDGTEPSAPNIAGNIRTSNGDIEVDSSVIAWAGDDGGITLSYTSTVTSDYNNFYMNVGGDFVGGPVYGVNDTAGADPLFTIWADDGDCHNDDFRPGPGSPLINTGNPAWPDIDGSVNDRGATGGPSGDIRWYDDGDGDGVMDRDDCKPDNILWNPSTVWYQDGDLDGFGDIATATVRCSPPDANWLLDGSDCDDTDRTVAVIADWYADGDGDGFGDLAVAMQSCGQPLGYVDNSGDCDDADVEAFPGQIWYPDVDGDTYGDDAAAVAQCARIPGSITAGGDCDDTDATVHPDTIWYPDADGDGFGDPSGPIMACDPGFSASQDNTDCDDADANIQGPVDWYPDSDLDGFGDQSSIPVTSCVGPPGAVANGDDCDDGDSAVNPTTIWYLDLDGDGFGDDATGAPSCVPPAYGTSFNGDCDDANPNVSPADPEICNGIDDDCDGLIDDADGGLVGGLPWYADTDGDGYGDPGAVVLACLIPPGHVANDADCDDTDAATNPIAPEQCDNVDHNCNGAVDDGVVDQTWYVDLDGDGFGTPNDTLIDCAQPAGYSPFATDCNDGDPAISPDAFELCNAVDDDCNGLIDDTPLDGILVAADTDGDGWGDPNVEIIACGQPSGYTDQIGDCDDTNPAISPSASETCNGVDDDCNGLVDDGATDEVEWYPDSDSDGWGDDSQPSIASCTPPSGYGFPGDCDDTAADVNPDGIETCDGRDEDCDGDIDEDAIDPTTWFRDADGDGIGDDDEAIEACTAPSGYVDVGGDCDDADASVQAGCDSDRAWTPEDEAAGGDPSGCDCTTAPAGPVLWIVLLVGVLFRRGER